MVNRQWLTPRLTTAFASITQLVAMQNIFVMSFLDTSSQWNKLCTRTQSAYLTEMNFATVNHKRRKKNYVDSFVLSING